MSYDSRLSLIAQYDDMCRLFNRYMKSKDEDEEYTIQSLEAYLDRRKARELAVKREKEGLQSREASYEKQIRKLKLQLEESRNALSRETAQRKASDKERKVLSDMIKMVGELLRNCDTTRSAEQRDKVINYLDLKRLSNVHSDDSSDGASGIDYDKTEDDIILDNNSDRPTNTDSNDMDVDIDDRNIEFVRQQLKKHEEDRRKQQEHDILRPVSVSAFSSPNIDQSNKLLAPRPHTTHKTLTSSSKSTLSRGQSLHRTPSTTQRPHNFKTKKSFKPEICGPCGSKISFYTTCGKCENCAAVCHIECKDKCPLPCVKIMAPTTKSRSKRILISDFVNSDANPKVPALIVHCCNEIERGDNIVAEGLYRVVVKTNEVESLQEKILKSKTGMPNLSREDVHLLCNVVKRFLQNLDESLITTTLWSHFSDAVKNEADERTSHFQFYIEHDLPSANRDTLAFIMQHLHAIAKHSAQNKMTVKYLVRTLAPTIVGNSSRNPSPGLIQLENSVQQSIMETLFQIEEEFWSGFVLKEAAAPSASLGSRLLSNTTSTSTSTSKPRTRQSTRLLLSHKLPTPRLKPLFS